ncbi:hypothetical protein [Bowmanella dokdonensis]|uniref:Uncharacterized protein n=1 Tax=Bowmanella dokdonensis TaxID=751969 RepID=A0A939DR15_9ALTE|nr:hypothetical protein [Bowmanella dokdonensis]MBN7826301.1 hypothetical protein [Bowmanella dokdonensis]
MGGATRLLLFWLLMLAGDAAAVVQLESREGYFVLNMEDYSTNYDGLEIVQLVEGEADFSKAQTFDITGQRQVTLSGFADGHYQARLADREGGEEAVLIAEIHVRHRSLYQALALFLVGLLAFSLLVGLLIVYNRKEAQDA